MSEYAPADAPFPLPEVDERGVDLSQIKRMLAMTVEERLDQLEAARMALVEVRDAFRRQTEEHSGSSR